jgi:hypothetical protein
MIPCFITTNTSVKYYHIYIIVTKQLLLQRHLSSIMYLLYFQ